MLRRMFGPKREEVAEGWRRLYNEELHNLYSSPDIIKVIKSRRVGPTEHVECMVDIRNETKSLVGKSEGEKPLWRLDINRNMKMKH